MNAIDRAYEAIQNAIFEGRYRPGSRLNERVVADELGMSRTPVREAIRKLTADGFVRHRPNSGVTVLELSERSMTDLADLRAHLAEMAGRVAAIRIQPDGVALLDILSGEILERIRAGGGALSSEVLALFRRFHAAVLSHCGNEWLARQWHQTTFLSVMHATYEDLETDEWARIALYYPALVEALRRRDGDLAGGLMRSYFLQAKYRLINARRKHSCTVPPPEGLSRKGLQPPGSSS